MDEVKCSDCINCFKRINIGIFVNESYFCHKKVFGNVNLGNTNDPLECEVFESKELKLDGDDKR